MDVSTVITEILDEIEKLASQNNAIEVINIKVKFGALTDILPDEFRDQFADASAGTIADGADIDIEISDDRDDPEAQSIILQDVELA
jgi:hydrogenase nickel incorporation protein HypA/HybF